MRGLFAFLVLAACSSAPDDAPASGGSGGQSGGNGGEPSAGAEAGGVAGAAAGSGGAGVGGSASTSGGAAVGGASCTHVPDTEPDCAGCGVDFYRCGTERAYWKAESGQTFECANADNPIPDCNAAHDAAVAWVKSCCG